MTDNHTDLPPPKRGWTSAGIVLMFSLMIGAGAGVVYGQTTIGLLSGLVVGAALVVIVTLFEKRRRKD